MKILITLSLALSTILNVFGQTNYYVDPVNGNNAFNGTSLGAAWKTIQKACDAATPNSIVQIKGGTYYENLVVNVSGTNGNPITFKNYMNESVIIDGTGTTGTTLLNITDKSYLTFKNLTFQNLTKNNAQGILVECSAGGTVTSLLFRKLVVKNIRWTANASATPTSNNNAQAFIAYGRGTTSAKAIANLVIDSCDFYNNVTGFSEVLSLDGNIDGFTVTNNNVHHNTNIGIYAGGNYGECSIPSLDHARNGTIEKNNCYKNVSLYATSGGIYADGAQNVIIRRNICYRNGYGIEVGCEENGTTDNITVINNLLFRNLDCGIAVGGYTTSTTGQVLNSIFRNNTLFQNDSSKNGSGEFYITKASNCVFKNNLVYTNSENVLFSVENISPQASNTFNYNCWFTPQNNANDITVNWKTANYSSFSAYKTGTSQDANSFYSNPKLVNTILVNPDLHIQTLSPCVNSGDPVTTVLGSETDYDGNARAVSTIDIGAFEYAVIPIISEISSIENNKVPMFVYPNPFSSQATLFSGIELKNASLAIYNLAGNEVKKVENISGFQIPLDGDNLPVGLLIFKVEQDSKVISTGKLIVE